MPEAVRALGFTVHTMAEVYPRGEDERVIDARWIADADRAGWVALTKDERIVRNAEDDYLETNINRIVRRSRRSGPFVDVVYRDGVERRWPRS